MLITNKKHVVTKCKKKWFFRLIKKNNNKKHKRVQCLKAITIGFTFVSITCPIFVLQMFWFKIKIFHIVR